MCDAEHISAPEITITPEMIEAGEEFVSSNWLKITAEYRPLPVSELVRRVYEEMEAVRRLQRR